MKGISTIKIIVVVKETNIGIKDPKEITTTDHEKNTPENSQKPLNTNSRAQ